MVPRSCLLQWQSAHAWVHLAQNGWVGHVHHLHSILLIMSLGTHFAASFKQWSSCQEFSELFQNKRESLALFVYRCVGVLSWAWPQQPPCSRLKCSENQFGLLVLFVREEGREVLFYVHWRNWSEQRVLTLTFIHSFFFFLHSGETPCLILVEPMLQDVLVCWSGKDNWTECLYSNNSTEKLMYFLCSVFPNWST